MSHSRNSWLGVHNSDWKRGVNFVAWVLKLVCPDQLQTKAVFSGTFHYVGLRLQRISSKNCTKGGTWPYQRDPEDKAQSKQWPPRGGSGPLYAWAGWSRAQIMAAVSWADQGILLVGLLEGQMMITSA